MHDLSKLTKLEKLRLLDVIEEKERRRRESKEVYEPNEGQIQVHGSDKLERWVFSGNGSGKTALLCNEMLWAAQGYNPVTKSFTPVPTRIICLLSHPQKIADSVLPELQKWAVIKPEQLKKRGKPYVEQITFPNGSEITFFFHHQDPMAFESLEAGYVFADEPFRRNLYVAMRRGMRSKDQSPRMLCVGTPIAASWIRKEVYDPWSKGLRSSTECFRYGTVVNEKNLAEGFIDEFSAVLTDKEKRIRLHGEFFDLDGLALAETFNHETHVLDDATFVKDDSWPCVVAIDPHKAKPHHAVLLTCDREGFLYVVKELSSKKVAKDFAQELKSWYSGHRIVDIVVDSMGQEPYSGGEGFRSFIQVLSENGVRCRATTYSDKSDEDFIDRIQTALALPTDADNFGLKTPKLRILRSCRGLINDIENVQWQQHRGEDILKPKLEISNRDYLACLKYALACGLTPMKGKVRALVLKEGAPKYGWTRKKKVFRGR